MALRKTNVEASWNVMTHAQKPDFVFRAKRTSPFKSAGGRQFSRLLAAEVCASAVVMLDTPCSEVVWRVRAAHSIRQFPLHFLSLASPCAITFQLESTTVRCVKSQKRANLIYITAQAWNNATGQSYNNSDHTAMTPLSRCTAFGTCS